MMKLGSLLIISIVGIIIAFSIPSAHSQVAPNDSYLLQASGLVAGGKTIQNSEMDLQLNTTNFDNGNMIATTQNGLVSISGVNYLSSGGWEITMLRNGMFIAILGDAENSNGDKIHLSLFGRLVQTNVEGTVYYFTGKITTTTDSLKVIYSAKISSISTINQILPQILPQQTPTQNQTVIKILQGASINNHTPYFSPSSIQITPGSTIVWENDDVVSHRIVSGTASAVQGTSLSIPSYTADGQIDTGNIAPGQSFKTTINTINPKTFLNPNLAKLLNLNPQQIAGEITFFDPTYPWMIGVITSATLPTQVNTVQLTILPNAYTNSIGQPISPLSAQITPGSTVIWKNNDSVSHRILSGFSITTQGKTGQGSGNTRAPQFYSDGKIDSGTIAPGQSFQVAIDGTGLTTFYDPTYTWINGAIISVPNSTGISEPPVQVSILPGSSQVQGSASQSNQQYYNQYYSPNTIQITPGTTIVWTNNDSTPHRIMSGLSTQNNVNPFTPDGKIDSGTIAPGQSFQITINQAGIIRFFDPNYKWMDGIIISIPASSSYTIQAKSNNPNLH